VVLRPPRTPREQAAGELIREFEATKELNAATVRGPWIAFALQQVAAVRYTRDVALCATGLVLQAVGLSSVNVLWAILTEVACTPLDGRTALWQTYLPHLVTTLAGLHSHATSLGGVTGEQLDELVRSTDPTRGLPLGDGRKLTVVEYAALRAGLRQLLDTLGLP
jgi:hypothetical protein